MPQKIFMITQGEYSDYQILAHFSTRELAEKWVEQKQCFPYYDAFEITEVVLDEFKYEEAKTVYSFGLEIISNEPFETREPRLEMVDTRFRNKVYLRACRFSEIRSNLIQIECESTVSIEHARKICEEIRQQWLRTEGFILEKNRQNVLKFIYGLHDSLPEDTMVRKIEVD